MKVILNEEVLGLGEPGKIVDVAPGYARNFLVPRKLAVYANTSNVREMAHHQKRLDRKRQRLQAAAMSVAEKLQSQTLTIDAHAGKDGKLFGSVTTADIATTAKQQLGVEIDRRKIHLREPIRTLGEHAADVHLLGDTHANVTVKVIDTSHPAEAKAEEPAVEAAPEAPAAAPAEEPAEE